MNCSAANLAHVPANQRKIKDNKNIHLGKERKKDNLREFSILIGRKVIYFKHSICKRESVGLCCHLEISGPQRAKTGLKLGDKSTACFLN